MIFLSKTPSEPYEIITESNQLNFSVFINDESEEDIFTQEKDFYLIVKAGYSYNNIRLVVENEYFTGGSFMISKTNAHGSPVEYKKMLKFDSLIAGDSDLVIRLKAKFSVINNEFLLRTVEFPANINIYQD